jgi:hypothetical protein
MWVFLCLEAVKPQAKVAGIGCETAVEAELEDNVGWRGRRGISTAPA